MIIANTASALLNTQNSFYYCGVEISKENFDISEFAPVCDKINDLKRQLYNKNNLSGQRIAHGILGFANLTEDIDCLCEVYEKRCFLGLFSRTQKEIVPLTSEIFRFFSDRFVFLLSYELNKIAKMAERGIITASPISDRVTLLNPLKDKIKVVAFNNYKHRIEKLSNCFYHTYELEFINGCKDYILTDEQLKKSLEER